MRCTTSPSAVYPGGRFGHVQSFPGGPVACWNLALTAGSAIASYSDRVMVVQYGSLPPLIQLLKSEDRYMKKMVVRILSNLMESLDYTLKAFDCGALGEVLRARRDWVRGWM